MTKVLKITGLCISLLFELLLLLVFVLVFAIRSSSVQSFLANEATAYLSKELNTKISIEKVDIVLFKHIDLKNIFIQDLQKAKLLHLAHLNIDLDRIKLINKQLLIKEISLANGSVNLSRSAENGAYNFQFLIDYFSPAQKSKKPSKPIEVSLSQLLLSDIDFSYHDFRKDTLDFGVDYDHIELKNLHLDADHITSAGSKHELFIRSLGFQERSGFRLNKLTAALQVSENGIGFRYLSLHTPQSKIYFKKLALQTKQLADFEHFDDKVVFDVGLQNSRLSLKDLSYFVPDLKGMTQHVYVAAEVKDVLKRLSIEHFRLAFGQKSRLQGNFRLPDFRLETNQLRFNELLQFAHLDFQDLEHLRLPQGVASIQIPTEIRALNYLELKNTKFNGALNNFSLSVQKAKTQLGNFALAPLRVRQEENGLTFTAVQSDTTLLKLENFNLGPLADLTTLGAASGQVNFSLQVFSDGNFAMNTLDAKLNSLAFNEYTYQNISIQDASILKNQLKAKVDIKDPHLSAQASLAISLDGPIKYQYELSVANADLSLLGLGERQQNHVSFELRGGIQGPSWSNISGYASASNLLYQEATERLYTELAQVHFNQSNDDTFLQFSSSMLDLNIAGHIDFEHISNDLLHHLAIVYPSLEPKTGAIQSSSNFSFDLQVRNAKDLLAIFVPELTIASNSRFSGSFDSKNENLEFKINCPSLAYQDFRFDNVVFDQQITAENTTGGLQIALVSYADSTNFHELKFVNQGSKGVLDAVVSWDPQTNDFSEIKWRTTFLPEDILNFNLQPSFFTVNGVQWEIANQSDILLSSSELNVSNFELHRGYQLVKING